MVKWRAGVDYVRDVFEFGGFRLDKAGPLLTHGVEPVEIAPKALEILTVLVSNAGCVVRKDDLMSVVWPNTIVEEGNIAVHVSSLRKALAEHGGRADYIQTVSKRGYRFSGQARRTTQVEAIAPNEVSQLFPIAEHYLQQHTVPASRKATAIYRRCLESDPHNARARAGLADSLLVRFIRGDLARQEGADAAMELLSDTEGIDPNSPEVHLSLSRLYCVLGWQWEKALAEVQCALALAADDATKHLAQTWHGVYLARLGDVDQGLRQLQQACSTIPLNPLVWNFLIEALYLADDHKGAAIVAAEALQLHPNHWCLHVTAARIIATLGDYTEALKHMRLANLLYPSPDLSLLGGTAYIHALAGRKEECFGLLGQISARAPGEYVSRITLAAVHAALGDKDQAVDNIEQACVGNEWYISGLKRDCCMDSLRTDPRFRRVLSQVGI